MNRTGLTFPKRFVGGRSQRPRGRPEQRAASCRRSSCDVPSETNEGRHKASLPSSRQHLRCISGATTCPSGITDQRVKCSLSDTSASVRVSVRRSACSQRPCLVPPTCQSGPAKSAVFRVHPSDSLQHPWCFFSADGAPSPPSTPPPTPFPSLTSLQLLRCASSCVAPSDPTVRNTCKQTTERNTDSSSLPMQGKKFVLPIELNVAVS